MSQHKNTPKARKSSQPKSAPWLWIVAVVAVLAVAGLLISRNGGNTQINTPVSPAPQSSQVASAARIAVDQDTFDYGNVNLGTTINTVFHIRNVGTEPLQILNNPTVKVVIGCCPPQAVLSSKVIPPGQEATITLAFMMHTGMGGQHRFNIDVQTNDPTQPLKQLVVLSNWI
jgi:archaellum component FlaG (FlaF/FlaG flagellin family)